MGRSGKLSKHLGSYWPLGGGNRVVFMGMACTKATKIRLVGSAFGDCDWSCGYEPIASRLDSGATGFFAKRDKRRLVGIIDEWYCWMVAGGHAFCPVD